MNVVNPIDPSEFINFQGLNQLIVPFCLSKSCSPLKTGYLRGILRKIWVMVGHGTSPIWLKFCMWTCLGVLTTKWMFQSSGKLYFGRFDHGRFRSVPKGSQYGGSKAFLSSFRPVHHNLLPKTINTALKDYLSTHILWQILCWNKTFWSWTSEKLKCTSTLLLRHINLL